MEQFSLSTGQKTTSATNAPSRILFHGTPESVGDLTLLQLCGSLSRVLACCMGHETVDDKHTTVGPARWSAG